jgi:ferredoxin
MDSLRASVNKNSCIGCGICTEICPAVFELDPMGLSEAMVAAIDPSLGSTLRQASESCPTNAITIL